MHLRKKFLLRSLGLALLLSSATGRASDFVDVLDLPSAHSELASRQLLIDVTRAGQRFVAVGQRGHIVYSDDDGQHWQQARVPVSSDLTAVHFPTPTQGWAVGHDGIVLHSSDSGSTWQRQLDGRQLGQLMLDYYRTQAQAHPEEPRYAQQLDEARRLEAEGADKPFLDVWFETPQRGYIIGAFNLIFQTVDGGRNWQPLQHRVDNPYALHLNAIAPAGKDLYIAGEQGLLLKLDPASGRFKALASPYAGSFFGLLDAADGALLAYGLRGHAFHSSDGGLSWTGVDTGTTASLTAGIRDTQGRLLLFSQAGQALVSHDRGLSFQALASQPAAPIAGATASADEGLILVGTQGVRRLPSQ
ncbi:WD40/YVTN/BNR-like repeat-containing protein [Marinobacterium rhizophilum]|uniref:Photosynthesis system II assembly factor Ycf48/Hcf136-like domain-containing protein n=1 Tax=Marinobacterium rhizophilum TaxID=420402 RepID=A0ABY5HK97_9GAMM|nr:YCF48-related protein [Marinobacterium rhizophilum]UTW12374.1 hypothetical protein KDW95_01435 [Marinobacterium rhizophilum]